MEGTEGTRKGPAFAPSHPCLYIVRKALQKFNRVSTPEPQKRLLPFALLLFHWSRINEWRPL